MGMELCQKHYRVHVRTGLGLKKKDLFSPGNGFKPVSNTNPECLEVFRHKFLMVGQVVTGIRGRAICSREIVVQPDFKNHFVLPVMTERYRNVLKLLPDVFVGGRPQLRSLLGLVCGEMEENFKGHHREVPPWRLLKSTLSKWCPKVCRQCLNNQLSVRMVVFMSFNKIVMPNNVTANFSCFLAYYVHPESTC